MHIGERHGKFQQLTKDNPLFSETHYIFAGKFRRYSGDSWLRRLTDVKTLFLNVRDVIYVTLGIVEAIWLLGRIRPKAIFVKGGFVGLPVGVAAALWRIPFITHDSDSTPGLTNRVIGRWARINATALPKRFYSYPASRVRHVGVPLAEHYHPVTAANKAAFKKELDIPAEAQVILVTGGSQGAASMNQLLAPLLLPLLEKQPHVYLIHQTGKQGGELYSGVSSDAKKRLLSPVFLTDMYRYSGAADLVITRASATTIAELAEQGRASILIPGNLADNHQLKNAHFLEEHQAALVFTEQQLAGEPALFVDAVEALLADETARQRLADQLQATALSGATQKLARMVLDVAHEGMSS